MCYKISNHKKVWNAVNTNNSKFGWMHPESQETVSNRLDAPIKEKQI